jgi:uncharacterized coiled-coil protein SlyX
LGLYGGFPLPAQAEETFGDYTEERITELKIKVSFLRGDLNGTQRGCYFTDTGNRAVDKRAHLPERTACRCNAVMPSNIASEAEETPPTDYCFMVALAGREEANSCWNDRSQRFSCRSGVAIE